MVTNGTRHQFVTVTNCFQMPFVTISLGGGQMVTKCTLPVNPVRFWPYILNIEYVRDHIEYVLVVSLK